MSGRKYYCWCDSNCKFETMTKEQILAAITQAVEGGEVRDVDTGFVTKVKEKNAGVYVSFWVGTTAQYNALPTKETNCMYILTDDTFNEDLQALAAEVKATANAAAETAAAATQTAKEAKAAAASAGLSREFNLKATSATGDTTMTFAKNLAWFYIIEVMDSTDTSSVASRETMALDYYSLISENTYEFANGCKICGYLSGTAVTIMILNPNETNYRLARFTGYI